MFHVLARLNGSTIQLLDDRVSPAQVVAEFSVASGVSVDGVPVTNFAGVDNSTVQIAANVLQVKSGGITPTQLSTAVAAAVALVAAIPTADQHDSVTIWNDSGVLKVSTGA